METTVVKPLEKCLLLLGTVVSAVLNYLYALKNTLGCSCGAQEPICQPDFCASVPVMCRWSSLIQPGSPIQPFLHDFVTLEASNICFLHQTVSAPQRGVASASGPVQCCIRAKLSWTSAWMLDWGGNSSFTSQICFPDLTLINLPVLLLGQAP